jgi:hypothetical protein
LVKQHGICRIIDVGISDLTRSVNLIEIAQRYAGGKPVQYTALDWFEARPPLAARLSLKEAYRVLRPTEVTLRLVPGSPAESLAAVSNAHQNTDLILISTTVSDDDLQAAWFFVPRMLHHQTIVLRERQSSTVEPSFEWFTHSQLAEWAGRSGGRRAA